MAYSTAPASDHREPSVRRQNVSGLCQSGSVSEARSARLTLPMAPLSSAFSMLEKLTRATPPMLDKRGQGGQSKSVRAETLPRCPHGAPWWTLLPQSDSQQLGQGEAVAAVAGKYGGQDEREQA